MRPLVVLGATGTIGRQTLEVASHLGIEVVGLAARRGSDELVEAALRLPEASVAAAAPTSEERQVLEDRLRGRVDFGADAVVALASLPGSTVLNGIVGSAGLRASVAALLAGNRLALANKESLVAGGPIVSEALRSGRGELIPVDSEHSALHQCLTGEALGSVRRLILSASGGPFRGRSVAELADVTPAEALAHPTWEMGRRITIDSATLMNKAFEVIEAHLLFDIDYDRIDVVVHPQSVVHSLVEFSDGSIKAQLGDPDMRLPIQYALTHPDRLESEIPRFEFAGRVLSFETPDVNTFPALRLGYEAGRAGGSAPAVLNAADEIAVGGFLAGRIGFSSIPAIVERTLETVDHRIPRSVDDVIDVDQEARSIAHGLMGDRC